MTTPNQPAPDGAYVIGGGSGGYGQDMTEEKARSIFMGPRPTAAGAWQTFTDQLDKMPLDALKVFQGFTAGSTDDDFIDKPTAIATITSSFALQPEKPDMNALQELLNGISGFGQGIWDGIVNAITGLTSGFGSWGQDNVNQAMGGMKDVIAQTAATVQAIQAASGGNANSGKSFSVNFADYPAGALPPILSLTYSGTGSTTFGVINAQAAPTLVNDADKQWSVVYNDDTLDDYQLVGCTFVGLPGSGFGNTPFTRIKARVDPGDTTYITLDIDKDDFNNIYFELGCVVSGARTVWKSRSSIKTAYTYWLEAGTSAGLRVYRVWAGSQIIWTHTEVGTVSQVGAGFRRSGFAGEMNRTAGGPVGSAPIALFSAYDNKPPPKVGSLGRLYRTLTGTLNSSAGSNLMPTNFFDVSETTADYIPDKVGGGFQVTNSGTYTVNASIKIDSGFPDKLCLKLFRYNGVTITDDDYSGNDFGRTLNAGATSQRPRWVSGSWDIYLNAGESVYLGYDSTLLNAANVFTGEATGRQTYVTIALSNKSLN